MDWRLVGLEPVSRVGKEMSSVGNGAEHVGIFTLISARWDVIGECGGGMWLKSLYIFRG